MATQACICLGIAHCHQAKFVHRDVKPENCLVFACGRARRPAPGAACNPPTARRRVCRSSSATLVSPRSYHTPSTLATVRGPSARSPSQCPRPARSTRERVSVAAVRPPLLEDLRSDCFLGRCGTPEFLAPEFIFSRDYRCGN